jgi:hypothetical protein
MKCSLLFFSLCFFVLSSALVAHGKNREVTPGIREEVRLHLWVFGLDEKNVMKKSEPRTPLSQEIHPTQLKFLD